jgi:hypothetical protein
MQKNGNQVRRKLAHVKEDIGETWTERRKLWTEKNDDAIFGQHKNSLKFLIRGFCPNIFLEMKVKY